MEDQLQKTFVIKVFKTDAENIRRQLIKDKIFNPSFLVSVENEFVFLPVLSNNLVTYQGKEYIPFEYQLYYRAPRITTNEMLQQCIPTELHPFIPTAIDFIGKDVALVKIQPELLSYKEVIGKSILATHKVKGVYLKTKDIEGVYRTTSYELLAGEDIPMPTHLEHGIRICVDLQNAYFNPRLANEHRRVALLVEPSETVIDMFCGVGPFPLHIAARVAATVYAIDINPAAISSLQRSMKLQAFYGRIVPITSDITTILPKLPSPDRIIMNLPSNACDFLSIAFKHLKPHGIIHFYQFIHSDTENDLKRNATELIHQHLPQDTSASITNLTRLRDVSPQKIQIRADIRKI